MMNTLAFVCLAAIAELVAVWLAYRVGHDNGWLRGWEERRTFPKRDV